MKLKHTGRDLLVSFLILLLGFGSWQLFKTNKSLHAAKTQLRNILVEIKKERQRKKAFRSEVERLTRELEIARSQFDPLNQKLRLLEKDNEYLLRAKQNLAEKVSKLEEERQRIEAKLHSIEELNNLIRQVKIEKYNRKKQEFLTREQEQKEMEAAKLLMGNRGFLIKNNKPTYRRNITIEVKSAD